MSVKLTVPNPVGLVGDTVVVANYRRSGLAERGTIERMVYEIGSSGGSWSYVVRLERKTAAGRPLRLTVGGADIYGLGRLFT